MFLRLVGKALFDLWLVLCTLFTTVLLAVMLVDGIPPSELGQCLDQSALWHTNSSK